MDTVLWHTVTLTAFTGLAIKISVEDMSSLSIDLRYVFLLAVLGALEGTPFLNIALYGAHKNLVILAAIDLFGASIFASALLLCASLSFKFFKGTTGLGEGDIWLAVAIGFWLQIEQIPSFIMASGLCGLAVASTFKLMTDPNSKLQKIPFAPAMFVAAGFFVLKDFWGMF